MAYTGQLSTRERCSECVAALGLCVLMQFKRNFLSPGCVRHQEQHSNCWLGDLRDADCAFPTLHCRQLPQPTLTCNGLANAAAAVVSC
jgi:hypothetical protein